MSDFPQVIVEMPLACPRCAAALYPAGRHRSQPTSGAAGRAIFILAGVVTTLIFVVVGSAIREHLSFRTHLNDQVDLVRYPQELFVGTLAFAVAIVPGLAFGYLASRMPRTRRLRSVKCRRSQKYPFGARWEPGQQPSPVSVSHLASAVRIIDDFQPWYQATAWAYAELREGRLAEDVARDLIENGWPPDRAEAMVDAQRRAARIRPARR